MDILVTVGSFIVALAILITIHEFGHFWVARRVGVRVLRFSIGFGRPLLRWRGRHDETEYVIAAVPLGGYVKMLDEREEAVPEDQLGRSFNRQRLWKRALIVIAGPASNLLFAVLVYWIIFIVGDPGLRAVIGTVAPQSVAAESGFQPGDELLLIGNQPVKSWETAIFSFSLDALDGQDLRVRVRDASGQEHDRWLQGAVLTKLTETPDLLDWLGLEPRRPELPAVIGEIVPGESAQQAGFEVGDRLVAADGRQIPSWQDWVALVREHAGQTILVDVERRDGSTPQIAITPRPTDIDGKRIGRIGAGVAVPEHLMDDYQVLVRYAPVAALGQAFNKTLNMSTMMLRVMGRMLIGESSVKNLSGPITIAEYAGRSASSGLNAFVKFLAVVSISLGVLNLLPIPVLDGGHLLYFLIEWVKGSPVSEQIQGQAQTLGFILLAALMLLAFYVDLSRLLG